MREEHHFITRSNWLRAAVLGANDGILSTASIAIGIAAASTTRDPIILAAIAGLVAGAFSMAAGEYVSVGSQADTEAADMERERQELIAHPEEELEELAEIYEERGLNPALALEVAKALTEKDALVAHARDELGISDLTAANPLQAAIASGLAFTLGGMLPVLVTIFAPLQQMVVSQYISATLFLMLLGAISAKTGGSSILKAVLRLSFWGTLAMGATALVGYLFGIGFAH